ncbi:hypothetical protein [Klebsiella pneumoniae]|uniref:hypothetical protein n=1 Tax=Klebsiella pneumoniae TaxID=573 RepID=UPI00203FC055|nr:hypothetical protein [Klebsiella pneumoniae]USB65935.1 hypothetical protein KU669_03490 [Klebsiella pneumoniae]
MSHSKFSELPDAIQNLAAQCLVSAINNSGVTDSRLLAKSIGEAFVVLYDSAVEPVEPVEDVVIFKTQDALPPEVIEAIRKKVDSSHAGKIITIDPLQG